MTEPDDDDLADGRGTNLTGGQTFEVDVEKRTIYGLAVPYNTPTFSDGAKFQFSKGSLNLPEDVTRVKLLIQHDGKRAVGKATALDDTDEGLWARFSVARGAEGDHALTMAADGVWDGLSIGLRDGAKFSRKSGVTHFSSAELREISLTPDPAFSSARVASVVAEAPNGKDRQMADDNTDAGTAPAAPVAFDMDAFAKALAEHMPAREVIDPVAPTGFEINETNGYAFENGSFRSGGSNEFSQDIIDAGAHNDLAAGARAIEFLQTQFAVAQSNVGGGVLSPGQNKVGFVDRREYAYPLTAALLKGNLDNVAPFTFPRFNSLSGLVGDHTEGVEPVPGALTTTGQTVTPKAMSGKVEITREVFDQGGNPKVSDFIFSKMVRGYQEALEGAIVTELVAQAANITDVTLPLAASGGPLVNSIIGALADLQYSRGGYTFDVLATQIDLYKALATAQDSTGRNLLPVLGPVNAVGTSSKFAKSLDIDGVAAVPAWALAATSVNRSNSWLIDSESVYAWASTPQRLDFNFGATVQQISGATGNLSQVAMVTVGIWGYRAVAIGDLGGVRQVTYDPAGVES